MAGNVSPLRKEFVQIYKGKWADTGEERWFLDWHDQHGTIATAVSDRATESEIEADAMGWRVPIVRAQPSY